jgi:hypothetical protein
MNPIYIDLHIHTSEDPSELNADYNLELLKTRIEEFTAGAAYLISFTDHNTINTDVYLGATEVLNNILVGVELHIKNYPESPAYHCHIFFNIDIEQNSLDKLNIILDSLYPNKKPQNNDPNIPSLEAIIREFDAFEFILLPHGGQSHSTFDNSIPEGVVFDTTLEKTIYYNQFDGFTARSNTGLERTQEYFKRLGIRDFVNLVTCTDNYNPDVYPDARNPSEFTPTWMLALPTFNGLRLSLSESSRLQYAAIKPQHWSEHIGKVELQNDLIDIDVTLTPGLNVIIGDSSTGKTLFADSIYNQINQNFTGSNYISFEVENMIIDNPSGVTPHYLPQNYITNIVSAFSEKSLDNIELIKNVFPGNETVRERVDMALSELRVDLKELISCVKIIEIERNALNRIIHLDRLIISDDLRENFINILIPDEQIVDSIRYSKSKHRMHNNTLTEIDKFLENNPLIDHDESLIRHLKQELILAQGISELETGVHKAISSSKIEFDDWLRSTNLEAQSKKQEFETLLVSLKRYSRSYKTFFDVAKRIAEYRYRFDSQEIESMGHKLSIEYSFVLNKETFIQIINKYLKAPVSNNDFNLLKPDQLFKSNHKERPKVSDYDDLESKINGDFEKKNKKSYKIVTSDGRKFEELSAGWKTSIILDIVLGYTGDIAPIIIDQPEDNLANSYINKGLIEAIKKIKHFKQVILVSHNATIPMLGDAQNIVLCRIKEGKLILRSNMLEGSIDGKNMLDYIASITDGGKASVKKRVKKYNLKNFKE